MPKPSKGPRLGSGPAHERALLRNLSKALITHGRVVTTEAKARRLRPFVERLVTKARTGDVHNRRLIFAQLQDKTVVHRLIANVAPLFSERPGGYTRILKLGQRRGDGSPMAIVEFVEPLEEAEEE